MERNLEVIRTHLKDQKITAPITGQLNSFQHERGQTFQRGEQVGRIDDTSGYLIRAQVDQHYMNRMHLGQVASIRQGKDTFLLTLTKLSPTIVNGQFEILLHFNDRMPDNIRRGQNFQVFVETSSEKLSHMVAKGSFFQSSGGSFVYRLSKEKDLAEKTSVTLGAQNPYYYEVVNGLKAGDQIIVSSYETFKDQQIIEIKNEKT